MHPMVASIIANEIATERREAARHVRAARRDHRAALRRVFAGR